MRRLLLLFALLVFATQARAQFPSPTFAAATVQGSISTGTLSVTGKSTLNGGGALLGTYTGPTVLSNVQPTFTSKTTSQLPASASPGTHYWVSDCVNGGETVGTATGCDYHSNVNGALVAVPYPPSGTVVTIGGQALTWGGSTANQGVGPNIVTSTGSITPGNALTVNAQGTVVDSGTVPSGGTGGGGTVANCASGGLPGYYAASGTTITCPTNVNNSVWEQNGSGVLTAVTTLPTGLTLPTATVSNPAITGTATAAVINMSGALSTAASAAGGANFNCPQGTAPTVPANGNVWCTSAGMFGRFNGATAGPFIGLTSLSGSGAISYNSGTGAFTCPNCLLGSAGGTLTPTAPIVISGTGISLGTTTSFAEYVWDSNTNVTAQTIPIGNTWPTTTGTIDSIVAHTGGTSTPSFTVALAINGTPISGTCGSGIVVSSSTDTTTSCSAAAITTGQKLTMVTSSIGGTPNTAAVQINFHRSNP
jgi:hypothetical protein